MLMILRAFSGAVLAVGVLLGGVGLIALLRDPLGSMALDALVLESLVALLVFAAILWMLTDILEALRPAAKSRDEERADPAILEPAA